MRLLVVEDDDEMRALMERGLAAEGYRVVAVENGVEALIALGEQSFDLAVVDVMMPGMSGFELARRIREREDPVRILLVTARDAVDLRLLGRSVGSVVDRPKILEEVWDGSQHVDPNVVEQYISYLRKKLTSHEATVAISTVRGRGYRLDLLGA